MGINYIDTAASYGKDENGKSAPGTSERHIGLVMKDRRHEGFLASKTHDRTYDGSMKLLETSLKNLQTDHLDIWQLHNVKWISEFSPLNEEQLAQIEYKTIPIVRQGLYFRRWELGA